MKTKYVLRKAIDEAKRFIDKAEDAISALDAQEYRTPSKHVAAAKRASMDLTRALAYVRNQNKQT